jgi:hypothetical protein
MASDAPNRHPLAANRDRTAQEVQQDHLIDRLPGRVPQILKQIVRMVVYLGSSASVRPRSVAA